MALKSPNARLIIAIVVLIALVLGVRYLVPKSGYYELASHPADSHWIELVERTLERLQLPEHVSWTVNPDQSTDGIELFVFDSAETPSRKHQGLFGNCSYLGDRRTIACDVALLGKIAQHYDLDKAERTESGADGHIVERWVEARNPQELQRDYETLMVWILAHELGHLLSGHVGQFYFANHIASADFDVENYCHMLEFEADSFVMKLLEPNEVERFYLFLYDLVNRELHGLACPDKAKVSYCSNVGAGTGLAITDDMIEYVLDGTHPDFSVRLLRMAELAQEQQDFGLFAYQLNQLVRTRLSVIAPNSSSDPCVR